MKNKNIINKELKVKVENFWRSWIEMVKGGNLKSEIEKCYELYKKCEGEFEDEDEEKYVLMKMNLSENMIECGKMI